jgi:hypothetical protein
VLFAAPEPGPGPAVRTVLDRLADRGLQVVTARSQASLRGVIAGRSRAAAPGGGGREGAPAGVGAGEPGAGAAPILPGRPAPLACALPIGAALLSWELFGSARELTAMIDEIQRLSAPPPVAVLSEQPHEQAVPSGVAERTAGSFWLHADSPHFVADQVEWLVRTYELRSQVLGALAAGGQGERSAAPLRAGQ